MRAETDIDLKGSVFADLSKKLKDQCPLTDEILENLFLTTKEGKTVSSGKRVHSATHALAILCSLKSQLMTNDFKTLFTLLCISYGAGMCFIGIMNHARLTISWKAAMNMMGHKNAQNERPNKESDPY